MAASVATHRGVFDFIVVVIALIPAGFGVHSDAPHQAPKPIELREGLEVKGGSGSVASAACSLPSSVRAAEDLGTLPGTESSGLITEPRGDARRADKFNRLDGLAP
jgi:hypothetical protein